VHHLLGIFVVRVLGVATVTAAAAMLAVTSTTHHRACCTGLEQVLISANSCGSPHVFLLTAAVFLLNLLFLLLLLLLLLLLQVAPLLPVMPSCT
jgi:hypothetical protein